MSDKSDVIIDNIQAVRSANNRLWMDILRLAMKSNPVEAKEIIRGIRANDLLISELTGELANE